MDFEPIIAILGTILVVAIGAAIIKKAVGCAITLVAVAIIAYLVKSGNSKSLKNVYIGAIAGIAASFAAAAVESRFTSRNATASPTPNPHAGTDGTQPCASCAVPQIANALLSERAAQLKSPDIVPASGPSARVVK